MANFNTHLIIGATVTGMAASLCYAAHLSSLTLTLSLWGIGAFGSLLPDVDSDNSVALKLLFNGLAVLAMALGLFWLAPVLKLPQLWLSLIGIYAVIRCPMMLIFKRFSRHRGVLHSLLAVLFVAASSAWFCYRVMRQPGLVCWLGAGFLGLGYLVHLILDECCSVDLANSKIKRSFGTALKLFSLQSSGYSFAMAVSVAWLVAFGPPLKGPWQVIASSISEYFRSSWA